MASSFWDAKFGGEPDNYFYGTHPNDFLAEHASLIAEGGQVLSIGEGEGRNAVFVAKTRNTRVTAVDASSVGLAKASRLAQEAGVDLSVVHEDLATFAIPENSNDAVLMIFCHLPSALRTKVLRSAALSLRPGGLLILELYRLKQLQHSTGGPKDPDLLCDLADLRTDLKGLDVQELVAQEVDREVVEGKGHTAGGSAVVQLIVKKEM